ncbi:MAG: DUF423 domain-containing protein [Trueperaceae bacterium]|nr:DUF423 domain-containing protein [Trueperaceae bacterium]
MDATGSSPQDRPAIRFKPAQLGAALAFIGIGLGAFGAHTLADMLSPARLDTFQTAVRYQMYHALGLLVIGALPVQAPRAALFLFAGSVVFSGSLYLLVATDLSWLGAVAPIGGVLQLVGWALLFVRLSRR